MCVLVGESIVATKMYNSNKYFSLLPWSTSCRLFWAVRLILRSPHKNSFKFLLHTLDVFASYRKIPYGFLMVVCICRQLQFLIHNI